MVLWSFHRTPGCCRLAIRQSSYKMLQGPLGASHSKEDKGTFCRPGCASLVGCPNGLALMWHGKKERLEHGKGIQGMLRANHWYLNSCGCSHSESQSASQVDPLKDDFLMLECTRVEGRKWSQQTKLCISIDPILSSLSNNLRTCSFQPRSKE